MTNPNKWTEHIVSISFEGSSSKRFMISYVNSTGLSDKEIYEDIKSRIKIKIEDVIKSKRINK